MLVQMDALSSRVVEDTDAGRSGAEGAAGWINPDAPPPDGPKRRWDGVSTAAHGCGAGHVAEAEPGERLRSGPGPSAGG